MAHIHDIHSIEDWTNHYVEKGQKCLDETFRGTLFAVGPSRLKRDTVKEHLLEYIPQAHQIKAAQLRASDSYDDIVGLTSFAGIVPGGKWVAKSVGARSFRNQVIQEYGLERDESVLWLVIQGMVDSGVLSSKPSSLTELLKEKAKEFAKDTLHFAWNEGGLEEEVHDELVREFGEEAAEEIFDEAASFVPVVGTVYSCFKGGKKAIKKLDEVLQSTQEVALRVHSSIVIPVVLERLGLGLKRIQELEAKEQSSTQTSWAQQAQAWKPYTNHISPTKRTLMLVIFSSSASILCNLYATELINANK